jgi:hypothetical protein
VQRRRRDTHESRYREIQRGTEAKQRVMPVCYSPRQGVSECAWLLCVLLCTHLYATRHFCACLLRHQAKCDRLAAAWLSQETQPVKYCSAVGGHHFADTCQLAGST